MIFDVTDKPTFDHIKAWLLETGKHADPSCNKLLVGNKVDREEDREVATDLAQVRIVPLQLSCAVLESLRFHAVPRVWIYRVWGSVSLHCSVCAKHVYMLILVWICARTAMTRHFAHTVGVCEVGRDRVH